MATKGKMNERLTMKGQIHKAYKVLLKLQNPKYMKNDQGIPLKILQAAKGIAFITVIKAGFVFSGTLGSGIVIVKQPDGSWSGPSSIGVAGMGWGALIGASSTDSVIILNTDLAVKTFSGKGQIKFGGNLSVAVGPIGREAEAAGTVGDKGAAPCYSYSHSRGLFGGLSLQGAILAARDSDNKKFYGRPCTPAEILSAQITPPENEDLRLLYQCLAEIERNNFKPASSRSLVDNDSSVTNTSPFEDPSFHSSVKSQDYSSHGNNGYPVASVVESTNEYSALGPIEPSFVPPPKPATESPLPPGWKELSTPEGEKYYWNEQKNTTQWERPTAEPRPTAPPVPNQAATTVSAKPFTPSSTNAGNTGSANPFSAPAVPPRSYR